VAKDDEDAALERFLARWRKRRGRLRSHALAAYQERTSQYQRVKDAQVKQKYLPEEYKLSHGIPLNIYDAARSYREAQGTPDRPLRQVLKDDRFRNAWGIFKGGYKWDYDYKAHVWKKKYTKRGGIQSTTGEKLRAAQILGWYDGGTNTEGAVQRLRNISP
jgi:hypothetical protein